MSEIKMLDAAIYYAKQGLAVFPIGYKSKTPIEKGGFKNATTNLETITKWWADRPFANIGIATGNKSGNVFVIDLDVKEEQGINGYDSLRQYELENGDIPDTANSITGGGGYHLFFRSDRPIKSRTGLLDGVDIRGDGGYIVAPPSIHKNGKTYEWEQSIEDFGITNANETIYELLGDDEPNQGDTFQVPNLTEGNRNDGLYRSACSMQGKGWSDAAIRAAVKAENQANCKPPLSDEEVDIILGSVFSKNKGKNLLIKPKAPQLITLDMTKDAEGNPKKVKQTYENFYDAMSQDENLAGRIRYNKFAYSPYYFGELPWRDETDTFGEWTDFDDSNLKYYLESTFGLRNTDSYNIAFNKLIADNSFSPVTDFLEALPEWDGEYRIENLLPDYLGVEKDPYSMAVMKLFMQGAINRAYEPGCKFDVMLVLVGEQGIGKSKFLSCLAMNPLWFDGNFNTIDGDKAVEKLRGKWILEMAELLAVKRQKDVESFKSFLTVQSDSYREPYGTRTTQRPRACVFAASTNDFNFMTDRTGNRRYMPVVVNRKNIRKSLFKNTQEVRETFEKCWAEALHNYKANKPDLILPKELQTEALQRQGQFLEEDPWVGMIQEYLDNTDKDRVCTSDIWVEVIQGTNDRVKQSDRNHISSILRNEIRGWVFVGRRKCGIYGQQRCWERDLDYLVELDEPVPF